MIDRKYPCIFERPHIIILWTAPIEFTASYSITKNDHLLSGTFCIVTVTPSKRLGEIKDILS